MIPCTETQRGSWTLNFAFKVSEYTRISLIGRYYEYISVNVIRKALRFLPCNALCSRITDSL